MLKVRVLTAAVLIPLTLAGLFLLGPRGWAIVTLLVVVLAAIEWADLAGYPQPMWLLFAAGTLLIGLLLLFTNGGGFLADGGWPDAVPLAVCGAATAFWLLVAPAWLAAGWRVESRIALALLGWLILIATWIAVVQLQARSPWLLLALMAVVWIADTAAYFVGRALGKHKLAPSISPGKTWEGVYGGLIATAAYALVLLYFAPQSGYTRTLSAVAVAGWVVVILGLTALSVVGDLFESFLKRQRGVKDSGKLLPGHGGVLDRIDALLAAMPAAALIARYALQ
jgi:phosphatidate cytidylyltransferase